MGFDDRTIVPNGFAIDKTESTNEIIFICFNRNVYTNKFPAQNRTRLLNRECFTVSRKTSNERWIKYTGLNNFLNISKVTKLDEGTIFTGNKVLFDRWHSSRTIIGDF